MPEFQVVLHTVRSGSGSIWLNAEDAASASELARRDCDAGLLHCPPEWCTDDVQTTVLEVHQIVSVLVPDCAR